VKAWRYFRLGVPVLKKNVTVAAGAVVRTDMAAAAAGHIPMRITRELRIMRSPEDTDHFHHLDAGHGDWSGIMAAPNQHRQLNTAHCLQIRGRCDKIETGQSFRAVAADLVANRH
jgi:hypothetical protein